MDNPLPVNKFLIFSSQALFKITLSFLTMSDSNHRGSRQGLRVPPSAESPPTIDPRRLAHTKSSSGQMVRQFTYEDYKNLLRPREGFDNPSPSQRSTGRRSTGRSTDRIQSPPKSRLITALPKSQSLPPFGDEKRSIRLIDRCRLFTPLM
jgi:hypothetical protein